MAVVRRNIHRALMNRAVPWPRFFFYRSNPIESMDDIMLFRRYRFRRETMVEIVGLCGDAAKATKSTLKSQKPESALMLVNMGPGFIGIVPTQLVRCCDRNIQVFCIPHLPA